MYICTHFYSYNITGKTKAATQASISGPEFALVNETSKFDVNFDLWVIYKNYAYRRFPKILTP